jgi:hypothetical protein
MGTHMRADSSKLFLKLFGLLCLVTLPVCSSASSADTTVSATFITVRPSTFRGNLVCGDFANAWQSYVATLIDITDPSAPFTLASSGPISCNLPVSFAWVVPTHLYIAHIDGYDRSDIKPFDSLSSGSPRMTDANGQDVAPKWGTECGRTPSTDADAGAFPNATESLYTTDVTLQDCAPFESSGGPSALSLNLTTVRGSLNCGSKAGQIDHFQITSKDGSFAPLNIQCAQPIPDFAPATADKDYTFDVLAFEANSSAPTWATQCEATARDSVTLPLACQPLTNLGALQVDTTALLTKSGHSCAASDIFGFRAFLVGKTKPATLLACNDNAVFSSLPPGSYQVMIDALDSKSTTVFSAICDGATVPAQTTTANCLLTNP